MDIDELINGLSASDLQEIEKSFGSESFSSFVDDSKLDVSDRQNWLEDRMIQAKQNVKKCESSLGTVRNKEKPNLIEDMITNKIICRDPEQEKRIARIKETKAEHERKRKVMQESESVVIDGIEINNVSLDQISELDSILNGSKTEEQSFVQLETRPRRRQRASNTSTKKTYDNLDELIADITAEKVTGIDFSTFRYVSNSNMSKILKMEQTISNVKVINFTGLELEKVHLILPILNKSSVLTEINLSSNRIPAPAILELMKVLEECSVLKILKIGRQSKKHFSYAEESKILKQLKKLQLRRFEMEWKNLDLQRQADQFMATQVKSRL